MGRHHCQPDHTDRCRHRRRCCGVYLFLEHIGGIPAVLDQPVGEHKNRSHHGGGGNRHIPVGSLDSDFHGGADGLDFYRAITENYREALKPGGYLAFEFGDTQAEDVCRILTENGYTVIQRAKDYNGIERAVLAQYGRKEENYGDEKDSL